MCLHSQVTGNDVPPAIVSFEQAGLDPRVLANVKRAGYTVPTPIQKHGIPVLQKGRDLMACAQTGSGKTAAFLLPMIDRLVKEPRNEDAGYPQAVIVTPTRELCLQVSGNFPLDDHLLMQRLFCVLNYSLTPIRSTKRRASLPSTRE